MDVHAELEKNAEVKELTDTLFNDFEGAAMAEYWVTGMKMVEILTQNILSHRKSNWPEFKSSLKLMLPACKSMTTTVRPVTLVSPFRFHCSARYPSY